MSLFDSLAKAEQDIIAGYPANALKCIAQAREAAIADLAEALCQGGDTRKIDDELQMGHFCLSTWEDAAWTLVEHGGYEWVDPERKYWIREKKSS